MRNIIVVALLLVVSYGFAQPVAIQKVTAKNVATVWNEVKTSRTLKQISVAAYDATAEECAGLKFDDLVTTEAIDAWSDANVALIGNKIYGSAETYDPRAIWSLQRIGAITTPHIKAYAAAQYAYGLALDENVVGIGQAFSQAAEFAKGEACENRTLMNLALYKARAYIVANQVNKGLLVYAREVTPMWTTRDRLLWGAWEDNHFPVDTLPDGVRANVRKLLLRMANAAVTFSGQTSDAGKAARARARAQVYLDKAAIYGEGL